MANASKLPDSTELVVFHWETPSAPNPTLNGGVSSSTSDTTLRFSNPPLDENGAVVTEAFLMGVTNRDGYTETIYVPAGALSADGLTATGVVRGIRPSGLDYTTGSSDFAAQLNGGSKVFCNITATLNWNVLRASLQGAAATGSHTLTLGDETAATTDIKRSTSAGVSSGFVRHTGTKAQYSDNGTDYVNFSDSSSSTLVAVSADDTTPGYLFAKMAAGDGIDLTEATPGGDEDVQIDVDVTDLIDTASGLTETANNIQVNLDADPGLEFNGGDGSLSVKLKSGGGVSKGSDGLFLTDSGTRTGVAYEALLEGDTLCKRPIALEWDGSLDESTDAIALGDANARFRYAIKLTATDAKTITDRDVRLRKVGSATQTITVSLQADSSGEPSGTALVSNTLAASSLTTSFATENFDFGAGQAVVKGTDYWVVIEVDNDDAANYVEIQTAATWYQNFPTAERLTYDLTGGTWGSSTSVAPFWCWGDETFGDGVFKTDRDHLAKVWSFEGFANAAYSAGDTATIVDTTASANLDSGSVEDGEVYYLSSTPGQLTTSVQTINGQSSALLLNQNRMPKANYAVGVGALDADGNLVVKKETGEKAIHVYVSQSNTASSSIITFLPNQIIIGNLRFTTSGNTGVGWSYALDNGSADSYYSYTDNGAAGAGDDTGYLMPGAAIDDITDVGIEITGSSESFNWAGFFTIRQQ